MSYNPQVADTENEIRSSIAEADRLTKKPSLSRNDRDRFTFLLSKLSLLKAGLSADEFRQQHINKLRIREGELAVDFRRERTQLTPEERLFRAFLNGNEAEQRDLVTNNPQLSPIATTGGSFVPLSFWSDVVEAMAQVDPLTAIQNVSLIQEPSLAMRPLQIPAWDLTTITSEQVTESSDAPSTDFITPTASGKLVGGFMHRLNLVASFEFDEDSFKPVVELLARAYGVGFARGISAQLVNGTGSGEPQGIATFAADSSVTNANPGKLVLEDFLNIYFSVNRIYRVSPKCAWVMGDSVYKLVRKSQDDSKRPLLDVTQDGETLLGKKVLVSPSLDTNPFLNPSLGPDKIIFGDLSHFYVRLSELQINRSVAGVGLIEKGLCLYQGLMRADSWLCDPSGGGVPPIIYANVS